MRTLLNIFQTLNLFESREAYIARKCDEAERSSRETAVRIRLARARAVLKATDRRLEQNHLYRLARA